MNNPITGATGSSRGLSGSTTESGSGFQVADNRGDMTTGETLSRSPTTAEALQLESHSPERNELHFYPGENLLVLQNGGKTVAKFEAVGGPSVPGSEYPEPREPTKSGNYIIGETKPYHTTTWKWSRLDWGTRLQDKKSDVWYELPGGKWGSMKNDFNLTHKDITNENLALYGKEEIPKTWVFNDFGPTATRWFKDNNGDGILNGNEQYSGQMFHTTPRNEAQDAASKPVTLTTSHGCIHLKPADRDKITALGGFNPGTQFIIHNYDEHFSNP